MQPSTHVMISGLMQKINQCHIFHFYDFELFCAFSHSELFVFDLQWMGQKRSEKTVSCTP